MPQWKQYSGIWTSTQQAQAAAEGKWPLLFDYELYTTGANTYGSLGLGDVVFRSSPVQVGSDTTWSKVVGEGGASTNNLAMVALKTNGTIWGWGRNNNGELGLGDIISRSSPVQIGALTNWSDIDHGGVSIGGCTVAIKTDGTIWSWGRNNYGQLGHNDQVYRSSPVQIGALTTWSKAIAGESLCGGIQADGTAYLAGYNFYGGTGDNTAANYRSSPVQVGGGATWLEISSGHYQCLGTQTDGSLWWWSLASNGDSMLDLQTAQRSSPTQIGALTGWSSPSKGFKISAAINAGRLFTAGENNNGQLGHTDVIDRSSPVQVGALDTWLNVSSGSYGTGAIKTDGTLWTWGNAAYGKLGLGDTIFKSSPVQVGSNTNWWKVNMGGAASFIKKA